MLLCLLLSEIFQFVNFQCLSKKAWLPRKQPHQTSWVRIGNTPTSLFEKFISLAMSSYPNGFVRPRISGAMKILAQCHCTICHSVWLGNLAVYNLHVPRKIIQLYYQWRSSIMINMFAVDRWCDPAVVYSYWVPKNNRVYVNLWYLWTTDISYLNPELISESCTILVYQNDFCILTCSKNPYRLKSCIIFNEATVGVQESWGRRPSVSWGLDGCQVWEICDFLKGYAVSLMPLS